MNIVMTNNLMNRTNLTEQYRRQAELMYINSYVTWLILREKSVANKVKKPA